jgi:hypothetical protein
VRVGLATFAALPQGFDGDLPLAAALEARGVDVSHAVWDDAGVDWRSFDRVVIRSVYDYSQRHEEFVAWARRIGDRLRNRPEIVEWNSHKRYLGDLAAAGLPVIPTTYVEPGDPLPELSGTVVVKPAVSAGGRDSGRFGPGAHDAALELLGELSGRGRTAMVQPFQESIETAGEAALVYFGGELSHTLRKGAVLPADRVAPQVEALPGHSAAEAMFDPDLVRAAPASAAELELGERVIGFLRERFGTAPLYARVDCVAAPAVMEIELIEPNFYFEQAPGSEELLAAALLAGA